MWKAVFEMLSLFGDAARFIAGKMEFTYDEAEEKGITGYLELVKDGLTT